MDCNNWPEVLVQVAFGEVALAREALISWKPRYADRVAGGASSFPFTHTPGLNRICLNEVFQRDHRPELQAGEPTLVVSRQGLPPGL